MSMRISPVQRLQAEIDEVFAGGEDLAGAIEQVTVLGAGLLLQTAIEAEVTAFLGRERYERAAGCEDARAGMRTGYCPTTVKTTARPVTLARPKVRGTTERFASQLFGKGVTKTNALEALLIAGFVRGLSVRDVEATLAEALGEAAAASRPSSSSAASGASMTWTWTTCFWTARISSTTPTRRPSRCWPRGASTPTANRCSSDSTPPPASRVMHGKGFWLGSGERGLACPLLVTGRSSTCPRTSSRAATRSPTCRSGSICSKKRWRDSYPAAVRCLLADRDSLTVYLRFRGSTGPGRGTQTLSSGPSGRPDVGSR